MGGNLPDYTVNSSHLWIRTKNVFLSPEKKQRISPLRIYIYIWRSILKESHWFMIFQGQTIFPTVSSRSAMKRTLKQSKSQGKLQEWTFTKSRRTQKSILRAPLNELAFPKKNMDSLEASINDFAKPTKKHHQLTFPKRWIIFDGVQTTPSFSCHGSATWAEHAAWMRHFPFAIHQEKRPQYLLLTRKKTTASIQSSSPPLH